MAGISKEKTERRRIESGKSQSTLTPHSLLLCLLDNVNTTLRKMECLTNQSFRNFISSKFAGFFFQMTKFQYRILKNRKYLRLYLEREHIGRIGFFKVRNLNTFVGDDKELTIKHTKKKCDFFGIKAYQLLLPFNKRS